MLPKQSVGLCTINNGRTWNQYLPGKVDIPNDTKGDDCLSVAIQAWKCDDLQIGNLSAVRYLFGSVQCTRTFNDLTHNMTFDLLENPQTSEKYFHHLRKSACQKSEISHVYRGWSLGVWVVSYVSWS
jgi:hypothetical protein